MGVSLATSALVLLALLRHSSGESCKGVEAFAVTGKNGALAVRKSLLGQEEVVAKGCYVDSSDELLFGRLKIEAVGSSVDTVGAKGMGMVEGYLTGHRIYPMYVNAMDIRDPEFLKESTQYFTDSLQFSREQANKQNSRDLDAGTRKYWEAIRCILARFDGMVEGYNLACQESGSSWEGTKDFPCSLKAEDIWSLNGDGDSMDIIPWMESKKNGASLLQLNTAMNSKTARGRSRARAQAFSEEEQYNAEILRGRCSAAVVYTGSDLLFGHSTWGDYAELLRDVKHLDFGNGFKMSFASFPGFLSSTDDWFVLSSGLFVMETSLVNRIWDKSNPLSPRDGLPSWIRTLAANALASTGSEWIDWFLKENGETYNCQWFIADLNLFSPGKPLQNGTLLLLETAEKVVEFHDITDELRNNHLVVSANIPRFKKVRTAFGYDETCSVPKQGQCACFESPNYNPRACILNRDGAKVQSVADLQALIRSNNFPTEPLFKNKPQYAVAGRFDLLQPPAMYGALDGKVTSFCLLYQDSHDATSTKGCESTFSRLFTGKMLLVGGPPEGQDHLPSPDESFWKSLHLGVRFKNYPWFLSTFSQP